MVKRQRRRAAEVDIIEEPDICLTVILHWRIIAPYCRMDELPARLTCRVGLVHAEMRSWRDSDLEAWA
jgi:hypothetical protein